MDNKKTVAVILINFNGGELILETLRSFAKNTTEPYILYILDNGSPDDSMAKIKTEFDYLKPVYLKSEVNLGFGNGINLVLNSLPVGEHDYVALINPDILLSPGWLGKLTAQLETDEKLAAIGPLVIYTDKFRIAQVTTNNSKLYYHFPDYRYLIKQTGEVGGNCREIFLNGREFVQINKTSFPIFVAEREKKIKVEVYDETSSSYELQIDKFHGHKSLLAALLTKILFKLKLKSVETKISQFEIDWNSELEKPNETFEVVNSLGAGIKPGKKLPENLQIGLTLEQAKLEAQEVEILHFACVVLKYQPLKEVGFFDKQYFMWYEDADLCLSLRKAGYKLKVDPTVIIKHFERGTKSTRAAELMQESQKKFLAKWFP